ncbi:MAG: ATP-binding protein, partial [Polyangiales bacterium]
GRFELTLGPVDLETLIREVNDQMAELAEAKAITLTLVPAQSGGRPLMADILRLRQVLINLVANAIKFSEPGGTVTVRWSSLPDAERITVEDQGIGIAPEDHERIFTSFEQVHKGDTRKYGGTGLGLSISRSLVRMHGGELSVESESCGGPPPVRLHRHGSRVPSEAGFAIHAARELVKRYDGSFEARFMENLGVHFELRIPEDAAL